MVFHTALFSGFRRELMRRPSRTLAPGEKITIRARGMKPNEAGDRTYADYEVGLHDCPQPSLDSIFQLTTGDDEEGGEEPPPSGQSDDDLPF